MHRGFGGGRGFRSPQRGKMYKLGGDKLEKGEKSGKPGKIGALRLHIAKRGGNRGKATNLALNRYRLRIESANIKNRNNLA